MGFLAELLEDVEAATRIRAWKAKRIATVVGLVTVIGYLLAASGYLGDTIKDILSTRGLSLFRGVSIEMFVQEEDPFQFEGSDHDDDELRVLVAGKVTPCSGPTRVVARLYRVDRPGEERPPEWIQQVTTDGDCRWRAPKPFFIAELGAYEVEAHVHRAGHDIGGTTEALKRIRPSGVEKSAPFLDGPARHPSVKKQGRVTVVYLAKPSFNRRVFERTLLELNRRMESFEVQIAEFDGPSCVKGKTSQSKDCFATLGTRNFGPGLVVGIVPNTLEDDTTTNLFSMVDASRKHLILSSDQNLFFNGRSSPSIYKYLLTLIAAAGATVGRDPKIPVFYHHGVTRGCLFDYHEEKIRAQLGVEMGYLCEEHRARFKNAKIAPEAFTDLTERLPLSWLK